MTRLYKSFPSLDCVETASTEAPVKAGTHAHTHICILEVSSPQKGHESCVTVHLGAEKVFSENVFAHLGL